MWHQTNGPTGRFPGENEVLAAARHVGPHEQHDGARTAKEDRARQAAALLDLRTVSTWGMGAALVVLALVGALFSIDGLERGHAVVLVLVQSAAAACLLGFSTLRGAGIHGSYVPHEQPRPETLARAAALRRPAVRVPAVAAIAVGWVGLAALLSAWMVDEPLPTWGWVCVVGAGIVVTALRLALDQQLRRAPHEPTDG